MEKLIFVNFINYDDGQRQSWRSLMTIFTRLCEAESRFTNRWLSRPVQYVLGTLVLVSGIVWLVYYILNDIKSGGLLP